MAVPSNTEQTISLKGLREDLVDLIYNVDPTETPILTTAKRTSATAVLHEWQTDALASAGSNAQVEGDDAAADSATYTTRLGNYTQISRKVPQVSGTARSVKAAGRKDELGYQIMKRAKELKRDMEYVITQNTAQSVGTPSTARNLGSLGAWIKTNGIPYTTGGGANPSTADGKNTRTDASTTTALTEANVKTCLADIFTTGGDPDFGFMSAANKQIFSGFSGNSATRYVEFDKEKNQKFFTAFDVYVSDFGDVRLVPDRFQRGRDVWFIDSDYLAISYLRPFETVPLSKTGDSDRKMLLAEYTLEMRNEKAHGMVADTTG